MSVSDSSAGVKSVEFEDRFMGEGFTQVPNVLLKHGMDAYCLSVYVMLLHYARAKEECWPGQEGLAEKLGCGRKMVIDAIARLAKIELISVIRRGQGKTNLYKIREIPKKLLSGTSECSSQGQEVEAVEVEVEVRPSVATQPTVSSDLQKVYDHWRTKRGRSRSNYDKISDKRRLKIGCRLREFSADELCTAIDNLQFDPWPDRAMFDDITVIFRCQEQVEKFLDMADTVSSLDKRPNGSHPAPNWRDIIRAHDNGLVTA